jgi:nucleoside-diphosphate-sugar epimerase
MNLLVTGGCGYVGSRLVPKLIEKGYRVSVIDTQWFGNFLPNASNLKVEKKALRDLKIQDLIGIEAVIHLANIANDPSVELNESLSWETNVLDTMHLLELCKKTNIKDFLYASSGSVYGIKQEERVTEELSLIPISLYNKTKMIAERLVKSYENNFRCISIRPATVCGYSPRMRLDVLINMFVWQAFSSGTIRVLGGNQIRPNIHIEDLSDVYIHFLKHPSIPSGAYNAGFENISVLKAAELVAGVIPAKIEVAESNDPRSYRQDSSKLVATGYKPRLTVLDAISELKDELKSGNLKDDERWHTVKRMKTLKIGNL